MRSDGSPQGEFRDCAWLIKGGGAPFCGVLGGHSDESTTREYRSSSVVQLLFPTFMSSCGVHPEDGEKVIHSKWLLFIVK